MNWKILFVDDEANILKGLRRMLRGMRKEWELQFAGGGEEALENLKTDHFDVIVTDMRMPGIGGADLLKEVAKKYPNVIRFVLSGQARDESVLEVVNPAHQFLIKPSQADRIKSSLCKAMNSLYIIHNDVLRGKLTNLLSIPVQDIALKELSLELTREKPDIQTLSSIVTSDVGITAKLYKLLSSSFFGTSMSVMDSNKLVEILGIGIIKKLLEMNGFFAVYDVGAKMGECVKEISDHSRKVSILAGKIAETETEDSEIINAAKIAGLLHDMGKLVMLALEIVDEEQIPYMGNEYGSAFKQIEREQGTSHSELGAALAGLWGYPSTVIDTIRFHHNPSLLGEKSFSTLTAVHTAEAMLSGDRLDMSWEHRLDSDYLNSLGLEGFEERLKGIVDRELKEDMFV
ncbi:HDOD domain-containing protein [bacterium]|nr:HDOD domain-containing protein [bacterium]